MKVIIEITCEDEKDLMGHLSVIRGQIRARLKAEPETSEIKFSDGNCYGDHEVTINKE